VVALSAEFEFDAVIVPGGGLDEQGNAPPWVRNRFDEAASQSSRFIIALSAGTPHKPPVLDSRGFPLLESVVGAEYLQDEGFPTERLLVETSSLDTIGNAYFARVIHTDVRNLRKLLVITSQFHLPRTETIFRWVFDLPPDSGEYNLKFKGVENVGLPPEKLKARENRESQQLEAVKQLTSRIRSLDALHDWSFSQHSCYAVGAMNARQDLDSDVRSSY
jgi:hypothetical protein